MSIESKMLFRSFLAYGDFWEMNVSTLEKNVSKTLIKHKDNLGFSSICWGPVAYKDHELFSESLVYILNEREDEYTIVVRGTNPFSLSSWIFQDLNITGLVPWARQSPNTTLHNGFISKATDISLDIHKKLKQSEVTILQWLLNTVETNSKKQITLNITGHSLGGLMCGTLAYYLMDELKNNSLRDRVVCNVYSFAAPTAGNEAFAKNMNKSVNKYHRYVNQNDIATQVWNEDDAKLLPELYKKHDIKMKDSEEKAYEFFLNKVISLDYMQPSRALPVKTSIGSFCFAHDYFVQAAYQHAIPYLIWGLRKSLLGSSLGNLSEQFILIIEHLFNHNRVLTTLNIENNNHDDTAKFLIESKNNITECISGITK